jgi:hypothetical protein
MTEANRKINEFGSGSPEAWVGAAGEATKGAVQKATEGAAYVRDKLGAVDETVRDYTGKPLGAWTEDLKAFMRERPLAGAALMVALGLVVRKFLRR